MDNPYIQRVSFEDIQEFKNLDLFDLTPEQTNGRTVLLAYDPESQSFKYAYMEDGTVGTDIQNLTIFYGYGALISSFLDDGNTGDRPSTSGFKNGDGIITNETVGTVTQFDFYEVEMSEDLSTDTYVFKTSSFVGGGGGAATIISDSTPDVVEGGTWYQPTLQLFWVGANGVWAQVASKGDTGDAGGPGVAGPAGSDGPGVNYIFYLSDSITPPLPPVGVGDPVGWTEEPTGVSAGNRYEYVSLSNYANEIWGPYSNPALWARFAIDGDPVVGDPGITYKTSTVFTRTSTLFEGAVVIVSGGHFSSPYPTDTTIDGISANPAIVWSDGIPAGTEKVWMTTFTYNSDAVDVENAANIWTAPGGITDTGTTDFQYSTVAIAPGTPTTLPDNWDQVIVDPIAVIWIAQRSILNGIFGEWQVWKVKGEVGPQGNGLDIKGRDTACNILNKVGVADYDIWLVTEFTTVADMFTCSGFTMTEDANANDAFLKVPDGTGEGGSNWDNIGGVVGTNGASFLYSIAFKRNVGNPGAPVGLGSFSEPTPVGWSDGIPPLVLPVPDGEQLWMTSRHFSDDPSSNEALAEWITPRVAGDSNDQEFSYAYYQVDDATPLAPNLDAAPWSDIPGETEYFWMATAKKINGVVDTTTWKVNRIRGEKGNTGEAAVSQFMAMAFLRTSTDIGSTPVTGGTYSSPIPTSTADGKNWSDGIPSTAGTLWFSQVQFTDADTANNKAWPSPKVLMDSATLEYMFSVTGTGEPVEGVNGGNGWWDDANQVVGGDANYMAIGTRSNWEWPTSWDIIKVTGEQGEPGAPASSYRQSTVFTRTSTRFETGTIIVSGGSFDSPYPSDTKIDGVSADPAIIWSDGIPAGDEKVWMSSYIFNDVEHTEENPLNTWSTPGGITDTGSTDFQYSTVISAPGTPTTIPGNWSDTLPNPASDLIWLAQRTISNGLFGAWQVWKAKGETGSDGRGLDIKGRANVCDILNEVNGVVAAEYDIWLAADSKSIPDMATCSSFTMDTIASVNDAFLRVADGTGEGGSNWDNIGGVVGSDGASFLYSIVFKRSVGNPGAPTGLGSFVDPVPGDWSDGIPTLVLPVPAGEQLWMTSRHFSDDIALNSGLADWIIPSVAADSNDQEFSFAYEQPGDATPALPNINPSLWSDVPGETNYYWMAKAKVINGVIDQTSWKINRIRGEQGTRGIDAVGQFMASAFLKTDTDITGVAVTGGTYLSPIPTSTAAGKSWSDGIPSGPGAVWFVNVQMLQTDTANNKVWTAPIKIIETSTIEYRFSSTGIGQPVEGNNGLNGWWELESQVPGVVNYMAIGSQINNEWPTIWNIIKVTGDIGPEGTPANTYVPSTMFCRSDSNSMATATVIGKYLVQSNGTFVISGPDPEVTVDGLPYTFTDGIPTLQNVFPNNSKRVWMIQGVLNDNNNLGAGNEFEWGNPVILADNGSIDYQYHAGASATVPGSKPAPPTGSGSNPDSTGWYDTPDIVPNGAFWLAQKNWAEGPGAAWVVYQIRGEDGADATGIGLTFSIPVNIIKYTEPGPLNSCQTAQQTGQGGVTDDGIIRYFSGLYPGDYISEDTQGNTMYNGDDEWISDGLISWRVNWAGKILERTLCPSWAVTTPSNVTAVRSLEFPTKIRISWGPSVSESGVLAGYIIERATSVAGAGRVIVGNVGSTILTLLDEPANAGEYFYTVYAKSADSNYNSARSAAASIQFVKTISMNNANYPTLGDLQGAFISAFSSGNHLTNTPFYTNSSSIGIGTYFTTTISGLSPYNGGKYWYANYSSAGNAGTAYQIDEYGIVIATGPVAYTYSEGTPPTAPSNLTISVDGGNASVKGFRLTWNASTDNVGVTGYEVWVYPTETSNDYYRHIISDTLSGATLTCVAMMDQCDMGQGIVYFKVRAKDAAGNSSAYSNVVSGYGDGC